MDSNKEKVIYTALGVLVFLVICGAAFYLGQMYSQKNNSVDYADKNTVKGIKEVIDNNKGIFEKAPEKCNTDEIKCISNVVKEKRTGSISLRDSKRISEGAEWNTITNVKLKSYEGGKYNVTFELERSSVKFAENFSESAKAGLTQKYEAYKNRKGSCIFTPTNLLKFFNTPNKRSSEKWALGVNCKGTFFEN
jgi:hypothetical protein